MPASGFEAREFGAFLREGEVEAGVAGGDDDGLVVGRGAR